MSIKSYKILLWYLESDSHDFDFYLTWKHRLRRAGDGISKKNGSRNEIKKFLNLKNKRKITFVLWMYKILVFENLFPAHF